MKVSMNAVDLFENLGVLNAVLWKSTKNGSTARVERRTGAVLHVQVRLPFCGTWIRDNAWPVDTFLASHKPVR